MTVELTDSLGVAPQPHCLRCAPPLFGESLVLAIQARSFFHRRNSTRRRENMCCWHLVAAPVETAAAAPCRGSCHQSGSLSVVCCCCCCRCCRALLDVGRSRLPSGPCREKRMRPQPLLVLVQVLPVHDGNATILGSTMEQAKALNGAANRASSSSSRNFPGKTQRSNYGFSTELLGSLSRAPASFERMASGAIARAETHLAKGEAKLKPRFSMTSFFESAGNKFEDAAECFNDAGE
jgi:hypothetical protein